MSDKIESGRLWLLAKRPYLATALFRTNFVSSDEVPTMGMSESWVCYYNPRFLNSLTVQQLGTIIYHELLHNLRIHSERRQTREAFVWNVAADLEINDDLAVEKHMQLPESMLTPSMFGFPNGLTAEEYYEKIRETEQQQHKKLTQQQQVGGSAADGVARPWENHEDDGLSEAEASLVRQQVASQVKAAGNAPGHLARWADELLNSKVPWYVVLRQHINNSIGRTRGQVDYTYSRPSRRQAASTVVLPSLVRPQLNAGVIIDTSGSINNKILGQFLAECKVLVSLCNEVTVYTFDTKCQGKTKSLNINDVKKVLKGGGGTRMDVAIEEAVKEGHKLIVVLTDGETPWPQKRPPAKVIVATTNLSGPEWATTVKID